MCIHKYRIRYVHNYNHHYNWYNVDIIHIYSVEYSCTIRSSFTSVRLVPSSFPSEALAALLALPPPSGEYAWNTHQEFVKQSVVFRCLEEVNCKAWALDFKFCQSNDASNHKPLVVAFTLRSAARLASMTIPWLWQNWIVLGMEDWNLCSARQFHPTRTHRRDMNCELI